MKKNEQTKEAIAELRNCWAIFLNYSKRWDSLGHDYNKKEFSDHAERVMRVIEKLEVEE